MLILLCSLMMMDLLVLEEIQTMAIEKKSRIKVSTLPQKKLSYDFKNYLMNPTRFLCTGWEQMNFLGSVLLTWESLKIIITMNTTKTVAIKCFQ